jgi:hypothetical protein
MRLILCFSTLSATALAVGCPYMNGGLRAGNENLRRSEGLDKRQTMTSIEGTTMATQDFLAQFELNDTNVYMTTDSGTPIDEAVSLKGGIRGPTLLEDFIFRQKLQRFDHERVSILLIRLITVPLISDLYSNFYVTRFLSVQSMLEVLVGQFASISRRAKFDFS